MNRSIVSNKTLILYLLICVLMADKAVETPLMKQYYSFKAKYPDAMLLFRVGDFY